ncbi:MAG: hypothetical protein ABL930_08435 [Pseudobdellovibrio sp.]
MSLFNVLVAILFFTPILSLAAFEIPSSAIHKNFNLNGKNISIITGWSTNPENGEDVLATQLSYRSNFEAKSVRWMQMARVQKSDDSDFIFQGFQEDRNKNKTRNGYYLDQNYDVCRDDIKKCSYFYRDHFTNPEQSVEIKNLSQIADYPFGWTQFKRITLESCAYEIKTKKYVACIQWGAEWPEMGDRLLFDPKLITKPSFDFLDALNRFKKFYGLK